jgi:predicted ester cyclase
VPEPLSDEFVEDLTKRVEEAFNARDTKALEKLIAPHFIDHSVLLGGIDVRQRLQRVLTAFPDARYHVRERIVRGNAVAWRWESEGPHTKDILGVAPTGKKVRLPGLSVAVIENGKAVQQWEFTDYPAIMAQLEDGSGG